MAAAVWDGMCDLDRFSPSRPFTRSGLDAAEAARFPTTIGYNNIGEIVAVGSAVDEGEIGRRVFTQARHCEAFDVERWETVPLPDAIDDIEAAPAYPATLGLHALRRLRWAPGEPVIVIGLCAALVADALGAQLILVGRSEARTQLASSLLPDALIKQRGTSWEDYRHAIAAESPRVAIEAAGSAAALRLGVSMLARDGRIAALGIHGGPMGPLLSDEFCAQELSIVGTSNDPYGEWTSDSGFTSLGNIAYVLSLISRGRLSLGGVCTDVAPAAEIDSAYAKIAAGDAPETVGVTLDWRGVLPDPTATLGAPA
jgi:threonine dehydrogenase-like Zn-dependent dehydrogenase